MLGRPILLVGMAAFVASACSGGGTRQVEQAELDHSRFAPRLLEAEVLYDGDVLGLPWRIAVVDGYLLVIDVASDSVLHLFDAHDGRHVLSFGRRGEGPGEFTGAWSIDPVPEKHGEAWVYDVSLRRFTRMLLADGASGRIDPVGAEPEAIQLLAEVTLLDPLWSDTLIVSLGFFRGGRLGHFDADGRFLRAGGELPSSDDPVPEEARQHAYQSMLAADPSRSRFVVATRHADLLEVLRADGTVTARADPPFGFLPQYGVREWGGTVDLRTGTDLRFGYLDVAATDHRVYALFSGRTRRAFPGAANQGEYVHVYDWDASLLEVYRLDRPAVAITADREGGGLFAVRHTPEPAVVRYALPRDVREAREPPARLDWTAPPDAAEGGDKIRGVPCI